ncbi:MAG: class I SAM-dependent methyltransferase [Candidatus Aminicenantes bacterium]|nr:class I SAM-dependent methyltransferase [Candidatus Aminicenantes bacterium]
MTEAGGRRLKRGPLSKEGQDFNALYRDHLQGEFYGADYYRPPSSDIDSAIIYDDNEDKRTASAFADLVFGPGRVLEVGCATGLLIKALRGRGLEAEGIDYSPWCVDKAHPAAREWVRWGDVLDPESLGKGYDLVLALDIFEHLPPDFVPRALANLAGALVSRGFLFTVLPAYGPNAFGPELYPLHLEEWRRDAALGIPFRNIPLDDKGRPHLGHLTHAAVPWWMEQFRRAGFVRLGGIERLLHERFDAAFEPPRRSFFLFVRGGFLAARSAERRLRRRIDKIPNLPGGFYEWERWGESWVRWTGEKARDVVERGEKKELRLRAVCHHPGIEKSPVRVVFSVGGLERLTIELSDRDWHEVRLPLPERPFVEWEISCSRTWSPEESLPSELRRHLGVAIEILPSTFRIRT